MEKRPSAVLYKYTANILHGETQPNMSVSSTLQVYCKCTAIHFCTEKVYLQYTLSILIPN